MSSISRRQFLSWLATGASISLLPALSRAESLSHLNMPALPLPPSIMLHSRHHAFLPVLVDWLVSNGWQGISYLDFERALMGETALPPKPIILSIDDLTMTPGGYSYPYFVEMKEALVRAGFGGVFSVVTNSHMEQDDSRWQEVAAWWDDGIELASHSASHTNLDNPDIKPEDFHFEIVESVQMIEDRTGHRVRSFVTPFGSGYDRPTATLHPQVRAACQAAGIRFVVGIVDGRSDLSMYPASDKLLYVGRATPGTDNSLDGTIYTLGTWDQYAHTRNPVQ